MGFVADSEYGGVFSTADETVLRIAERHGRMVFDDPLAATEVRMRAPQTDLADILVFGPSAAREALLSGEQLTAAISGIVGRPTLVRSLTNSAQTLIDVAYLLSVSPPRRNQVVVVHVNENGLVRNHAESGYIWEGGALRNPVSVLSARFGDEAWYRRHVAGTKAVREKFLRLRTAAWRAINYPLRHFAATGVFGIVPERELYLYADMESLPDERKAEIRSRSLNQYSARLRKEGLRHLDKNLSILRTNIDVIESAGAIPVVAIMPRPANADFAYLDPVASKAFWTKLRRFLQEREVPILDVAAAAGLTGRDFVDASHVYASGRSKWSREFVRSLADFYRAIPAGR